jgi:hypothetical protein
LIAPEFVANRLDPLSLDEELMRQVVSFPLPQLTGREDTALYLPPGQHDSSSSICCPRSVYMMLALLEE